jgi:predicted peptidase
MAVLMKLFLLAWIALGICAQAQERTWTSNDGKQLVGEFLQDKGDAVVLKIKGKKYTIQLTRLSEEDGEWIAVRREAEEQRKKEDSALAGTMKSFAKNESQKVTFHVYYPTSYSTDSPRPMLILFSASGRGRAILDRFKESCESVGWIGIGCDTFRNGVDESIMDPLFEGLLPVIEKTVPHDPQRLYLGGISGGASRAFGLSAKFDRPWKGIISCGGWLGKRYDLKYAKGMAVAWVNGDKDKAANSWVARDTDFLRKFSCKTKLFEFSGGHVIGPPEVLTEAMRWAEKKAAD